MNPEKFSNRAPKPIDFAAALKRKRELAKAKPPKTAAAEKKPAAPASAN